MEVKKVDGPGQKTIQEQEAQFEAEQKKKLEDQEAAKAAEAAEAASKKEAEEGQDPKEIDEESVLNFLRKKSGKEIESIESILSQKEKQQLELPEDVKSFLEYKQKTGRGIDDFVKLNRDFKSMDEDSLIRQYLASEDPEADEDEIEALMEDLEIDEDTMDATELAKAKRARRQKAKEALEYFESQKDQYMKPAENAGVGLSKEEIEEIKAFKEKIDQAKNQREKAEKRSEWFSKKTQELFSEQFDGFKYKIGDQEFTFNPGDKEEVRKAQSSPMNFVGKYLNEEGMIEDAAGYHRALAAGMNPDKFAEHFFKLGAAAAREGDERTLKNVNLGAFKASEHSSGKTQEVRAVKTDDYSGGLKVRKRK